MNRLRALVCVTAFLLVPAAQAASAQCLNVPTNSLARIDMQKVRTTWLAWLNRVRKLNDLPPYGLSGILNDTATNWSAYAAERGTIDHHRSTKSAYYDYGAIEQWFAQKGVTFKNVGGTTFTENVGWGPFRCASGDCTPKLISAIRSTFSFYVAERGKKSNAHYRSIVDRAFTVIGLGIAISPAQQRYYLTVHYAARITSGAPVVCSAAR